MSLPSPPPPPPPDEEQLAITSVRTAFGVFATLLGIALVLCACTFLVHRTQPAPQKADRRSFKLTTRRLSPPAGSSSRSRTASKPAPASNPYDVTSAVSPDGKGTVIKARVSTPPGSERKKREHRPVPRQADAMSASRAKVDPVRLHLDSALQALDELAYDEKPVPSQRALPLALPPDFTGDADPEEGAAPPDVYDDEPPAQPPLDPCFGLCSRGMRRACRLAVCCLVVLGICVGFAVSLLLISVENR